ncbi:MAG: mechanosensitive ion channel family protein [Deltaproteobacteria bacterium]|nr:mechanosensitive ion channel family protein [Deltaproteobacteria bacterium]
MIELLKNITGIVVIQVAFILIAAWLLTVLIRKFLPWVAEKFSGRHRLYILASVPVLCLFILVVAIVLVVPRIIEPSFENLVTVLGALGLALGFAFKDYVGSLIAGIVTLYEMPYRLGDWISIEGAYGEVKSIGIRALEIVTADDTVVVIPHQKLWDHLIFNANNGSRNLLCVADFYLRSPHDSAQVKQTLEDVGLTSSLLQLKRPVQVVVQEKPWGTHYRLKAYPVDPRDQFRFITDLTIRGKAALTELGVKFTETSFLSPSGSPA